MTTATMKVEARKASFVRRVLTEVNSIETIDHLNQWLDEELACTSHGTTPTHEELHSRLLAAQEEILNGNTFPAEEMFCRMEAKYPWLCE